MVFIDSEGLVSRNYLKPKGGNKMFIDGKVVAQLREEIGMSCEELAEHLTMDIWKLQMYESGAAVWYEEDMFRLFILSEILPSYDYMIDGQYASVLAEIEAEYN